MSFEDELRGSTLTQEEIEGRSRMAHEEEIRGIARSAVYTFKDSCKYSASQGNNHCETYAGVRLSSGRSDDDMFGIIYFGEKNNWGFTCGKRVPDADKQWLLSIIKEELVAAGFVHANANISSIYKRKSVKGFFGWHEESVAIGQGIKITASW